MPESRQEKVDRVSKEVGQLLENNGCILRTQVIIEGSSITTRAFIDVRAPQPLEEEEVEVEADVEMEVLGESEQLELPPLAEITEDTPNVT